MKHVLIASLGGAPQVITEALWAMMQPKHLLDPAHRERAAVAPELVYIVATAYKGAFKTVAARDAVIREKICALYRQYSRPLPEIEIVPLVDGDAALPDIRDQRQNVIYANTITGLVRRVAEDDETTIHMLLAGGRKSMSSYDQSAMMFFGRAQDELMHVLVDPEDLERCPDFWWPDQSEPEAKTRQGEKLLTDAGQAQVDLVNVPFVRLGVRLPHSGETETVSFDRLRDFDYERLVEYVQFEQKNGVVLVDFESRSIIAGGETARLGPQEFVFFALMAIIRKAGWLGVGPSDEGFGPNAGGWVSLNSIRHGLDKNGAPLAQPELRLAERVRDIVFNNVTDARSKQTVDVGESEEELFDWVARSLTANSKGADQTMSMRSRCAKDVRAQLGNPFIADLLAPASHGKGPKAATGLLIPPERLELRGFTAFESWINGPKRPAGR